MRLAELPHQVISPEQLPELRLRPAQLLIIDCPGQVPARAMAFTFGAGDVLHMISHYYLQRAELRTSRHQAGWAAYASEVGQAETVVTADGELAGLTVGEVEAAHTSLRFMANVVLNKHKRNRQHDR